MSLQTGGHFVLASMCKVNPEWMLPKFAFGFVVIADRVKIMNKPFENLSDFFFILKCTHIKFCKPYLSLHSRRKLSPKEDEHIHAQWHHIKEKYIYWY